MRKYLVWCPDHGQKEEDAKEFEGTCAERAAERFAEHDDRISADYTFCRNGGGRVRVKDVETGVANYYDLEVETIPEYTAALVREKNEVKA